MRIKNVKYPNKFQNSGNYQNNQKTKISRGMPILTISSLTKTLLSNRKWGFRDGKHTHTRLTDIKTYRLNRPIQ